MTPGSVGEQGWPPQRRLWPWLLSKGAFSKPFFLVAAAVFFQTFVHTEQVQIPIGNRILTRDVPPSLGQATTGLVIALLIAALGAVIHFYEVRSLQRGRDRNGLAILQAVLGEDAPHYFLYLRPFFLTRRMDLANANHGTLPTMVRFYSEGKREDLETMLERAVRKSGPLIALGQPGEMIGAGRLAVAEEEWKSRFEVLARKAACIFIVPSERTGTRSEIEWLRDNGYLSKAVFIMPPKLTEKIEWRRGKLSRIRVDMESLWKRAAARLAQDAIHLPLYSKSGLLFKLDEAGGIRATSEFGDGGRLRAGLAKIAVDL
jgi:hypothetical protein